MKTNNVHHLLLCFALLMSFSNLSAQNIENERIDLAEMKIELFETKLDILKSRVQLIEEEPDYIEQKIGRMEHEIEQIKGYPGEIDKQIFMLDSLIQVQQSYMDKRKRFSRARPPVSNYVFAEDNLNASPKTFEIKQSNYVVSILPVKLFEGSMEMSLERVLNQGNSLEISAMATYASPKGISSYYLSNQSFEYFSDASSSFIPYSSESITGYGGSFSWRNYLQARTVPGYSAPGGLYVAPRIMARRLTLSGFDHVYFEEDDAYRTVEVIQKLNVFSGGILAGWQFVIRNVITVDVYLGGMIRLSKYDGIEGFTKYKGIQNIDFSGVMPTAGVKFGIVK
ncbi:MAG: hypothetical protein PF450_06275 [Bacteroidales bacterium]|jgi:hypothetical protein|nr:hypothetical protein [Bacteroidales bacterium]